MELLLAFIIFTLMMLGLVYKQYTVLVCSYICFVVFYDWIFIQINLEGASLFSLLLQLSQEIIILLILAVSLFRALQQDRLVINREDKKFLEFIILPMVLSSTMSLINGDGIGNIIAGLRLYFIPLIIPYILYRNGFLSNIIISRVVYTLVVLSLICLIYGIFQVNDFSGDLSELWFYKNSQVSFVENTIDSASFNFIRDGDLRATGPFVSSIILTTLFAVVAIITLFNTPKVIGIPAFLILLYGINSTHTRVGFIVVGLSICIYLFDRFKYIKTTYWKLISIPIIVVFFTFISIALGFVTDLSSLGRVVQYVNIPSIFTPLGYGVGSQFSMIKFDSLYISALMGMGLFSILYVYYIFYLTYKLYEKRESVFAYSIMLLLICCIYLFAFQFTAGSASLKILYLMIFIAITQNNNNDKRLTNSSI